MHKFELITRDYHYFRTHVIYWHEYYIEQFLDENLAKTIMMRLIFQTSDLSEVIYSDIIGILNKMPAHERSHAWIK